LPVLVVKNIPVVVRIIMPRDPNRPIYFRVDASIIPDTIGPMVWPISIIVARNPMAAP